MSDTIIKVENLSKRYILGARRAEKERYTALRDVMAREARALGRKTLGFLQGRPDMQDATRDEFWALKDVSFEVKRGEVLGIIGRNGAGKSTLLKILSRITKPTAGRVELRGRVASLLEVGTGFHPELTGRENIFLNGAILGMTKAEIRKKFDEIVNFAEVDRFLDTPVKRYSSGMYVRLAFSVAAHLEPDVLIVDEVLAVGDATFQKKCFNKLDRVANSDGVTVILVSHDLNTVKMLSSSALLFSAGKLAAQGAVGAVLSSYLATEDRSQVYCSRVRNTATPHVDRLEVVTSNPDGVHEVGGTLTVEVRICHRSPIKDACFALQIVNAMNIPIVCAEAYYDKIRFAETPGMTTLRCVFPSLKLNVGQYSIKTHLTDPPIPGKAYEVIDNICHFEVQRTDKIALWGWRPEVCSYFEEFEWTIDQCEALV